MYVFLEFKLKKQISLLHFFLKRVKKALNIDEYKQFLETLAKDKKMNVDQIKQKLVTSDPPLTTKTTVRLDQINQNSQIDLCHFIASCSQLK